MAARKRVTVVTAVLVSTCPRMLKAADALAGAGYDVRMVATRHEPWATVTDFDARQRRALPVEIVNYRQGDSGATYWWTGAQHRLAWRAASALGVERVS